MTDFSDADLQLLTNWDTPTICNALEVVAPHRRATGFTVRPLVCLDPALKPIVGRARTATIRAMDTGATGFKPSSPSWAGPALRPSGRWTRREGPPRRCGRPGLPTTNMQRAEPVPP